jgi:predicted Zn-dependent peptidase
MHRNSKGQFMKGNPGKPKGSTGKVTHRLRELVCAFLDENFETIRKDFDELTPRDRIKFYTDLLAFGLPKLSTVEMKSEIERLTPEEIERLAEEIIQNADKT